MDPARSVACYNVPPEFAKKGEIANFFKLAKCTIAVDPSFNHLVRPTRRARRYGHWRAHRYVLTRGCRVQIQFLRGPDNGCCFVQFETKADVQKALARNGANLGNNEITVSLPFGLQTCTPAPPPPSPRLSLYSRALLISVSVPPPVQRRAANDLRSTRSRETSLEMPRPPPSSSAKKVRVCVRVRWCVCV
jgi:hypothetical protein